MHAGWSAPRAVLMHAAARQAHSKAWAEAAASPAVIRAMETSRRLSSRGFHAQSSGKPSACSSVTWSSSRRSCPARGATWAMAPAAVAPSAVAPSDAGASAAGASAEGASDRSARCRASLACSSSPSRRQRAQEQQKPKRSWRRACRSARVAPVGSR